MVQTRLLSQVFIRDAPDRPISEKAQNMTQVTWTLTKQKNRKFIPRQYALANDGQCVNLISFSARNDSAVVLTLMDRTLVHRRYLPNNVGTHLQLSVGLLIQIGGK